jgi:hypothetical protein
MTLHPGALVNPLPLHQPDLLPKIYAITAPPSHVSKQKSKTRQEQNYEKRHIRSPPPKVGMTLHPGALVNPLPLHQPDLLVLPKIYAMTAPPSHVSNKKWQDKTRTKGQETDQNNNNKTLTLNLFPPNFHTTTQHITSSATPLSMSLSSHNVLPCGSRQCVQTIQPPISNSEQKRREARSFFSTKSNDI